MTPSSSSPPPSPRTHARTPLKVLCITLGGSRRSQIESMFSSPNLKGDFDLHFIDGVPSRSLRNKPGLMSHAYKAKLLVEDPEKTFLAGKKTFQRGLWPDLDYAEELWRKGRSINRERSVLACLFAHLNAMAYAVENGFDVIIEDNVRVRDSRETYDIMRGLIDDSKNAGVRYFGYLGPRDNLEWLYLKHMPKYEKNKTPFPFNEHYTDGVMRGTSLWGAYAYMVSEKALDEIMAKLQNDIGAVMWKGKRMKTYRIKPIDKQMPRTARDAGLDVRVGNNPVFFRAPMLTSKIHTKFDAEFCKSTQVQLDFIGVKWEDLWLTEEEKETVEKYRATGKWTDDENRDAGKRDEREEEEKDEILRSKIEVEKKVVKQQQPSVAVALSVAGVIGGLVLYMFIKNRYRRA
ncbi:hypothetical protein TrST_g9654 [Triparma strigata]|uniref:Uncharacterized protein n=1 Tax=Triparma strigata TaxID=1606541 RepID=A0A9W7A7N7_9STRA|nr:hypothetical protein TrST_g9654 [Triparma strigata]